MPEGPEIRRTADRLAAAITGRTLHRAWFAFPALKPFEQTLPGRRVVAITPHGKALLTRFDHGFTLYSHNQLYGVWAVAPAGERPQTTRSLRVVLETVDNAILLYSASDVSMMRDAELAHHPFLSGLGPDVLDPALTITGIETRLMDRRFAGRSLSALLLDQHFLAGMGNYLRAEVLFEAGLSPRRRPRDLSAGQRRCLASALREVPRRSYLSRGIQPASGMRREYLSEHDGGFRFRVFDRAGQPCPRCGDSIVRETLSGRRIYICPSCQR